jgi:hypothetical protein
MPRKPDSDVLFLTEAEIARRLGKTPEAWLGVAKVLEREGLPRADPLFDGRRYWPAIEAFFHRRHGLHSMPGAGPQRPDGKENWNV